MLIKSTLTSASMIESMHSSSNRDPGKQAIHIRCFVLVISKTTSASVSLNKRFADYREWEIVQKEVSGTTIELGFETIAAVPDHETFRNKNNFKLILGDGSELDETSDCGCMASSACIDIDFARGLIEAYTSIVGLPPLFIYKGNGVMVLTSGLHLLSGVVNIRRELDDEAAYEMLEVGYPLEGRTLLKNVRMVTAGKILDIDSSMKCTISDGWCYPELEPLEDWGNFLDAQSEAFLRAVRQLDVDDSFLSLSGGLDTRAVFAALIKRGAKVPASTLSGQNLSLDARIAKSLCLKYQTPHFIVSLDQEFAKNLPEYTSEASRLSGGLASLEQAHEVYFYRQLRHIGSKRISGNLGNQVGRGGVEGTSTRHADTSLLNRDVTRNSQNEQKRHWLEELSNSSNAPLFKLLLQHEVPYTSVGNYCIGQHYAVQQSPYANRCLIETTTRSPVGTVASEIFNPSHARMKDLRHRFLGVDPTVSFQRKVILSQGGYVAKCPINWGWRAKGGISLSGLGLGVLALCDAYACRSNPLSKMMAQGLALINAAGMHVFKQYDDWLTVYLHDFVHDTLCSKQVLESGLLNRKKINQLLNEYYSEKKPRAKDLIAALDVSLAIKHFSAS